MTTSPKRLFSFRGICLAIMLLPVMGSLSAAWTATSQSRAVKTEPASIPPLSFPVFMDDLRVLRSDRSHAAAEFTFKNRSAFPVKLTTIRPSCGCLTTRLVDLKMDYAPGEQGRFFVEIELAGETPGPKRYHADIEYDLLDPATGKPRSHFTDRVYFRAEIPEHKLIVEPPAIAVYQSADGVTTERLIKLTDYRKKDFVITKVELTHPQIESKIIGLASTQPLPVHHVQLLFKGSFPENAQKAIATIHTTDATYSTIRVPIIVQGMPGSTP